MFEKESPANLFLHFLVKNRFLYFIVVSSQVVDSACHLFFIQAIITQKFLMVTPFSLLIQVVLLLLIVIFAIVHSGLASIRDAGEELIGERAYRVLFAGISLPLAVSTIVSPLTAHQILAVIKEFSRNCCFFLYSSILIFIILNLFSYRSISSIIDMMVLNCGNYRASLDFMNLCGSHRSYPSSFFTHPPLIFQKSQLLTSQNCISGKQES